MVNWTNYAPTFSSSVATLCLPNPKPNLFSKCSSTLGNSNLSTQLPYLLATLVPYLADMATYLTLIWVMVLTSVSNLCPPFWQAMLLLGVFRYG